MNQVEHSLHSCKDSPWNIESPHISQLDFQDPVSNSPWLFLILCHLFLFMLYTTSSALHSPQKSTKSISHFEYSFWVWCIRIMCFLLCKFSCILFPIQCLSLIAAVSPTTDLNLTQCLELYIQFLLRPCFNSITSLYFYYHISQTDLYALLVCCVSIKICMLMDLHENCSMIFNYHHNIIYGYLVLI